MKHLLIVNMNKKHLLSCFRLQDVVQSESLLKTELKSSFRTLFLHLKKRMDDILKESEVTHRHCVVLFLSITSKSECWSQMFRCDVKMNEFRIVRLCISFSVTSHTL